MGESKASCAILPSIKSNFPTIFKAEVEKRFKEKHSQEKQAGCYWQQTCRNFPLLLLPAHLPKPHLKDNPVLRVSLLCIAGTGFSFFFFLLSPVISSQLIKGFASPYKPCLALTALIATDIQNSLANFGAQQRSGAQKQCTQDCRAMPFRGTVHKTDFH